MDPLDQWKRYRQHVRRYKTLGLSLDISRMAFDDGFFDRMAEPMHRAYEQMARLEAGAVANPDEERMVGHYWLRAPELAPSGEITRQIEQAIEDVERFAARVHDRQVAPPDRKRFTELLLIGIGGSALGPQFVADALGTPRDKLRVHFMDNTDPDGFDRTLRALGTRLRDTLVAVVSKSGGTKETRNGMMAAQEAFADRGLDFTRQAVAITGVGSELDGMAEAQGWLHRFPMWDWVGGRTSITSAVGLVPMALQGLDIRAFLEGAAAMDRLTRAADTDRNPAARLALMWHFATGGRGARQMVVLPYKDRLLLLSRYLQQLVMESLGKERDLEGNVVEQGLTVYGNKGSTDQHAFVQQLRDGLDDFFVTFVTVQQDTFGRRPRAATEVEPDVTSGDYLMGFWQGTRQALSEKGRGSITLTLDRLDARTLGGLIALYERAVGLYASLVNINAYHQPGVEAGKKAAGRVIDLQQRAVQHLREHRDQAVAVEDLARQIGEPDAIESLYHAMEHLVANRREIRRVRSRYQWRD